ncbi:FAD-dependent monooxygenase [Nonomuraea sp. MCN248]|uniref:FAD-dependent monooxygenase n=1 Tax=Nonomuraea corallina TaxID=2989783 RepID=A0ABT4SG15_9ACTN|nr:FAD-dependent monooxygenase [Nonomuraea corallina]MDA0636151.1 FAD-dependent monooxygenase [Nonomuraea corallina]
MAMTTTCDVAIVGAGLGGCFLALLLGRNGHNVVVVEQGPAIPAAGADFVKRPGMGVLARHGLGSLVERHALKRDIVRYYHDGEAIQECRYPDGFLIRPYRELVEVIYSCCSMQGVEFWFDSQIERLEHDGDRVARLVLADGRELRPGVVIAADGSRSMVRQALGITQETSAYPHIMRVATVPLTASVARLNRLYFNSDGWFSYLYPINEEQARVFIGLPLEDEREVFADGLAVDAVKDLITDNDDAYDVLGPAHWQRIPVSAMRAPAYHRGNAALLGSAAFACHPMTGMGMSYTMHDAEILAGVIGAAEGDPVLLEKGLETAYEPRRHAHAELIGYGDALAGTFHDKAAYLGVFREDLHVFGDTEPTGGGFVTVLR